MAALGPYGVTNDRLDTVSNYYRYVRSRGESWPIEGAEAYALVEVGAIVGFEVVRGGSGYTTPPSVSVPGFDGVDARASLVFGREFETNGAVGSIALQEGEAR